MKLHTYIILNPYERIVIFLVLYLLCFIYSFPLCLLEPKEFYLLSYYGHGTEEN